MYKRILVATDGSTLSKKAVNAAISLSALCGAELIAVKIVPRYPQSYFEGSIPLSVEDVKRVESQWSAEGKAVVDTVKTAAEAKGVIVKAVTALMAAATKHKADLIVMASHGRRGIKRLLLGSETQHVLTHSPTPVLVLR